jgi:hypothetical protein
VRRRSGTDSAKTIHATSVLRWAARAAGRRAGQGGRGADEEADAGVWEDVLALRVLFEQRGGLDVVQHGRHGGALRDRRGPEERVERRLSAHDRLRLRLRLALAALLVIAAALAALGRCARPRRARPTRELDPGRRGVGGGLEEGVADERAVLAARRTDGVTLQTRRRQRGQRGQRGRAGRRAPGRQRRREPA